MPIARDKLQYMVGLWDNLSGWSEFKALRNTDSRSIAKYIFESWIACYGCLMLIVNDGEPKYQLLTKEPLQRYNIGGMHVAAYYPQPNG
jgi:hypothetical protein